MLYESKLESLSYDDVLLLPQHSEVPSRDSVNLFNKDGYIPIFSAPMKNISTDDLVIQLGKLGSVGVLHRFFKHSYKRYDAIDNISQHNINYGISISLQDWSNELQFVDYAINKGCEFVVIDSANAYLQIVLDAVERLYEFRKYSNKHFKIISGNVVDHLGCYDLAKAGADMIRVNIGTGCFAAGTRILMANGTYKDIEKINIEDEVIDGLGNPTKVIGVKRTGNKRVIRYKNAIHYDWTYCTPDHNHRIYDFNKYTDSTCTDSGIKNLANRNDVEWGFAFEFNKRKYLTYPNNIYFNMPESFEINLEDFAIREKFVSENSKKIIPSYELGYVFGTFLGDGHAFLADYNNSEVGSVIWTFGENERDIADKLIKCCEVSLGKTPITKIPSNTKTINVELYYQCFSRFLQAFGKRKDKGLPIEYWCKNKKYLEGILDGLIDSDGFVEKYGRFGVSNTSISIIELFSTICYLLYGSFPSSRQNKKSSGNLKGANIDNFNRSYQSRLGTSHLSKHADFYALVEMLEKENIDSVVPVYDIEVESEDHSFIANGVVVHNSQCLTSKSIGIGCPSLTAIRDCSFIHKNYPEVSLLADGGIYTPGDALKALAFGSDGIMIGSLFGRAKEAKNKGIIFGMSSYTLQERMNKSKKSNEGKVTKFSKKEIRPLDEIFSEFTYGLKSGLSQLGCDDINKLHDMDVEYIRVNK